MNTEFASSYLADILSTKNRLSNLFPFASKKQKTLPACYHNLVYKLKNLLN